MAKKKSEASDAQVEEKEKIYQVNIYMKHDEKESAKAEARRVGLTLSSWIRMVIKEKLRGQA